jgi:hypothetical protein
VCKAANEFADANYSLLLDGAKVAAYVNIGGGQENSFEAHGDLSPAVADEWQQVALTYNGDVLSVYRNGRLVGSTQVDRARTRGTAPLTIGARQDDFSRFDGDIDDVRIYSRALSEAEIAADYAALGPDGTGEPIADHLAGSWDFDSAREDPAPGALRVMKQAGPVGGPRWEPTAPAPHRASGGAK